MADFKKILTQYDPGYTWDGNSEYGAILGYTFVQALQAAGKNLTRSGLVQAIEQDGASFKNPGLVPFTFSQEQPLRLPGRPRWSSWPTGGRPSTSSRLGM